LFLFFCRPQSAAPPQAVSDQPSAFSFRLLAIGCVLCGLTPGGARKIVAGYKDFDVW
jgi:hypothetical protein